MGDRDGVLTRRDFVRTSAAAAAAAGVLATPGLAAASRQSEIRVALVGCGGRGTGAAAQALQADDGVVIWAVADAFEDRATRCAEQLRNGFGSRVQVPAERVFVGFDAYKAAIDSGADVVILATPPHFRPMHLDAAVRADKHVFCEKPMAVDAPGLRMVIDAARMAERKGLSLVSGFCWRYSSPERATYERIHNGAIGDIRSMHVTYHTSPLAQVPRQAGWSDMEWQMRNWKHMIWLSGDHIVEQACHSIDKINWAMQGVMPSKVTAMGGRGVREGEASGDMFDHFSVIYEYENGARCFMTCRQQPNSSNDNTDYIMGSDGTCYVNGWGPTHVIDGKNPWSYEGPKPNMYQVEHDELFASIRSGTPINDGEWMANSTMLAIIGRMAAYTGRTITWEEAMNSQEDLSPPSYTWGDLAMPTPPRPGTTKFI